MTVLTFPLTRVRETPHVVALPVLLVRLAVGKVVLPAVEAVVDTAAPAVLVPMALARRLGLSPEHLRDAPARPVWEDSDGFPVAAYGASVALTLRGVGARLALGETPVYFTEAPFQTPHVRLGQAGFLDRLRFTQYQGEAFELAWEG